MKRWWIVALTAFLALSMVIGVSVALASGGSKTDAAQGQQTKEVEQEQDTQEPSYQSSITVPEPEPANLDSLAKITADQAKEAALAASPGATITQVELDNENGNLVWGVEFTNGIEVKVDAGNGMVVHTENDANEASESDAMETE
jgi:uncharacterized membrane protein YkoI